MLPQDTWIGAVDQILEADIVLIIGTTGKVYPSASLPNSSSRNGAKIIEINPTPSEFTNSITDIYISLGTVE